MRTGNVTIDLLLYHNYITFNRLTFINSHFYLLFLLYIFTKTKNYSKNRLWALLVILHVRAIVRRIPRLKTNMTCRIRGVDLVVQSLRLKESGLSVLSRVPI